MNRHPLFKIGTAFFLLSLSQHAFAETDPRFGFAGTGGKAFAEKFGLSHYILEGNYPPSSTQMHSTSESHDPEVGYEVVRRVAKLTERSDGLGESLAEFQSKLAAYVQSLAIWFTIPIGVKPVWVWYSPPSASLAAAESSQIVQTIRREKTKVPAITGTVWEIGNEPNFFPPLLPGEYGELFSRYYRIIKSEDSTAKVAFGSLFVHEVAEDIIPKLQEYLRQTMTGNGLGSPGEARFDSIEANVRQNVFSRLSDQETAVYARQALQAVSPDMHPDIISIHVYPYDDRLPIMDKSSLQEKTDRVVVEISDVLVARGGKAPVWVTEFGNIDAALSETEIASQLSNLIDIFIANESIEHWYYYKATGADQQFAFFAGSEKPLTRLAIDSGFTPPDGRFSCAELNLIGRLYFLKATGQDCEDETPLVNPFRRREAGQTGLPMRYDLTGRMILSPSGFPPETQYGRFPIFPAIR